MANGELVVLLVIAALNAYSAWSNRQTRVAVEKTEKNTNSLVTKLVATTAKASHQEGVTEERLVGEKTARDLLHHNEKKDK